EALRRLKGLCAWPLSDMRRVAGATVQSSPMLQVTEGISGSYGCENAGMPAANRVEHEYDGTFRSHSQASASHVLLEPGRDDGPGGIAVRLPPGPPLVWKRPDLLGDGQRAFRQGRFYEARERWEAEGLVARGAERIWIQGLAEVAGGFL